MPLEIKSSKCLTSYGPEELEACQGWHSIRGKNPADSLGAYLPNPFFNGKEWRSTSKAGPEIALYAPPMLLPDFA